MHYYILQVMLEIRDDSSLTIMYEGTIPFEQLFAEA